MQIKYLLLSFSLLFAIPATAQVNDKEKDPLAIFNYVERMPAPGFDVSQYLGANIHYPDTAIKYNIEGRVIVKFVVNEDGSISDGKITKSVSKEIDEEALRVVRNMPAWRMPGMQEGKAVKVYFNLPIVFKLRD